MSLKCCWRMVGLLGMTLSLNLGQAAYGSPDLRWLENLPGMQSLAESQPKDIDPIDVIVDGTTFRYLLEVLLEGLPGGDGHTPQYPRALQILLDDVIPQVSWIHLKGSNRSLDIEFKFQRSILAAVYPLKEAKLLQLYRFFLPEHFTLRLETRLPYLVLSPVGKVKKSLYIMLKIPVVPDKVYLHSIQLNPADRIVKAKAGILWDLLRFTKTIRLTPKSAQTLSSPVLEKFKAVYTPFIMGLVSGEWEESKK